MGDAGQHSPLDRIQVRAMVAADLDPVGIDIDEPIALVVQRPRVTATAFDQIQPLPPSGSAQLGFAGLCLPLPLGAHIPRVAGRVRPSITASGTESRRRWRNSASCFGAFKDLAIALMVNRSQVKHSGAPPDRGDGDPPLRSAAHPGGRGLTTILGPVL
jgi:hypothetical protein